METSIKFDQLNSGGVVINKSGNVNFCDFKYKDIVSLFEKYGLIIFRGFELNGKEITKFTDKYTEVYSRDALRRDTRFDSKKIRDVDYGFSKVDLHSEASFAPSWPEIIWFYCNVPAENGGETMLCDGIKLWDNLLGETKRFFLGEQIHYHLKIPFMKKRNKNIKKPWFLPVVGAGNGFVSHKDGCLHIVQKRYAVQESRMVGQFAFANHLFIQLDSEPQLISINLSNHKDIPNYIYREITDKAAFFTYDHIWEKNDLLMLDNKRFMHGRRSLTEGDQRDIVNIQSQYASFGYGSTTRSNVKDIN